MLYEDNFLRICQILVPNLFMLHRDYEYHLLVILFGCPLLPTTSTTASHSYTCICICTLISLIYMYTLLSSVIITPLACARGKVIGRVVVVVIVVVVHKKSPDLRI